MYFHNAINKYGENNFIFEEIDSANSIQELNNKERFWIDFYNSNNKEYGYNLDSGGNNGGRKSDKTKKKIGETTKIKWENPYIAQKMLEGLRKGNETQKNKPKKIKSFKCAYCGKEITVSSWEANKRLYCSNQCVADDKKWKNGVEAARKKVHDNNMKRKNEIKNEIEKWVINNKEIVLNCPKNKIRATLSDLIDLINNKYGLKDIRSLYDCFDNVKNMKSFLIELQKIIPEENIC